MEKTAATRMSQPSELRGLRQATTKPTTPAGAVTHTGVEPVLAFRLWCASPASGTAAAARTSTRPPSTSAATYEPSHERPAPPGVTPACPAIQPPRSRVRRYARIVPETLRLIAAG